MMNYLIDLVRGFRVADFFDIAIISVLTYAILIWFKKTASRFVLIGISILGLVYILGRVFQLYLTVFVLQGFFAIVLIAMVVIFQEDLRLFFERLARWGGMRERWSSGSADREINILAKTVGNLARKQYGALIVIRGNDLLDRHLQGGTLLEAKLSEALLESLFDPHSEGHDGAAVIEEGQVVKFGCHLPLSPGTKESGNLGLRHSAALGLAERSDALVMVVSEERGTMNVARHGMLKELDDTEQLKTTLEHFYQERSPRVKERTWLNWVKENPRQKATAILLACGLWLVFGHQTGNIRRDFVMPLEYRNLPSDWIIAEPKPKEATATLMGSEQAFDLLDPRALRIVLDMSEVNEGRQELVLKQDQVRHPSSLTVVGIEPDRIRLVAQRMVRLDAPIKVQTSGTLPPGLTVRQVVVDPKSIQVMALPKERKRVQILTEPINLEGITTTFTLIPKLVLPPDIRFVNSKTPPVQVTIEIDEQTPREKK